MCFSAPASFTASIVLAGVGGTALVKSRRQTRAYALVPLIFSLQQAIEGGQWLAIQQGPWNQTLGYLFVFFAFIFWPAYIPWAVLRMEPQKAKQRILKICCVIGLLVAVGGLGYVAIVPFTMSLSGMHIVYDLHLPLPLHIIGAIAYISVVCGSLVMSSYRFVRWSGVATFASLLIAMGLAWEATASVWCYFAAVLSLLVALHVWTSANQGKPLARTRAQSGRI